MLINKVRRSWANTKHWLTTNVSPYVLRLSSSAPTQFSRESFRSFVIDLGKQSITGVLTRRDILAIDDLLRGKGVASFSAGSYAALTNFQKTIISRWFLDGYTEAMEQESTVTAQRLL